MHLARLAWIADSNCRLLLSRLLLSRLGLSRTTTQDLLLTRPVPMDSLTDLLPCDAKQVAPLLLAWHQSPPELPDLDRAKHVSIQLQALNWSSEFCDERSESCSEYEPSSILATYQALERMLKQRRGKPFAEPAPAPALVPPEQSCCVCGHVVLECKETRPMPV